MLVYCPNWFAIFSFETNEKIHIVIALGTGGGFLSVEKLPPFIFCTN
jgi:hypothetical protein